jgi:hypothetical protein
VLLFVFLVAFHGVGGVFRIACTASHGVSVFLGLASGVASALGGVSD